jgi:Lysyl-tRNA synthetase (class I)
MLRRHLGQPLTRIPDPFGKFESFGHHNNAMLRRFLDGFGFDYEFQSSTDWYMSGRFDQGLLDVLGHYDAIMEVMLPSLREERQQSYSPFLPISPKSGRVLQVPILEVKQDAGTVVFRDEDDTLTEVPVTGGHCKLQWKPDWAMRWHALGVDYEMSGKDLIPSVELANKICRVLGSPPPDGLQLRALPRRQGAEDLEVQGQWSQRRRMAGLCPAGEPGAVHVSEAAGGQAALFRRHPRAVDDYLTFLDKYPAETPAQRLENPVWHIHDGNPPVGGLPLGFGILLNLASVAHAQDKAALWGYISRYVPDATRRTSRSSTGWWAMRWPITGIS